MYHEYKDRFFTKINGEFDDLTRQADALLRHKSEGNRKAISDLLEKARVLFAAEPQIRVLEDGDVS